MSSGQGELRQLLSSGDVVQLVGVHDGLGAKIAQESGADALWASGLGISAAGGVPDAGILTLTQFLDALRSIRVGSDLPVVADCDSGFGDVNTLVHLIGLYEDAGAAGVCIEDKQFPKRNSFTSGGALCEPAEFAAKIAMAISARRGTDLMVWARLESLVVGESVDQALDRAKLYVEAGADALVVHSKASEPTEVLEFADRWAVLATGRVPIVIIPTMYPSLSVEEASRAGISAVVYANQGLRAQVRSMFDTCRTMLAVGSSLPIEESIASVKEVLTLIGTDEINHRTDREATLRASFERGKDRT